MAADALRIRRAAAARVNALRRSLPASGEQSCRRAANSWCRAATPVRMRASIRVAISGERDMRCFELFEGKHI